VRRLRVQLTVLLALLGLLVVAWGATIFLGARDAARTNAALLSTVERFDGLRRRSASSAGASSASTPAAAPSC
jgi:hypothetical protein